MSHKTGNSHDSDQEKNRRHKYQEQGISLAYSQQKKEGNIAHERHIYKFDNLDESYFKITNRPSSNVEINHLIVVTILKIEFVIFKTPKKKSSI